MRWPWQRTERTGTAAAGPVPTDAASAAAGSTQPDPGPVAPAGWAFLPALQREVDRTPPAALRPGFVDALPTRVVPASLGTMGHLVDARAPAGTVAVDDAALGAPIQRATAVDLPLRPARPEGGAGSGHRSGPAVSVQRAAVSQVPVEDAADVTGVADVTDAEEATSSAAPIAARPDQLATHPPVPSAEPGSPSSEAPATDVPTLGAAGEAADVETGAVAAGGLDGAGRGDGLPVTRDASRGPGAADLPVQRTIAPGREPAAHERSADDRQAGHGERGTVSGAGSGEHSAPTIAARSIDRPAPPPTSAPTAPSVLPSEARRPGLGPPLAPAAVQRIAGSSDIRAAEDAFGTGAGVGPVVAGASAGTIEGLAAPEHPHDSDDVFAAAPDAGAGTSALGHAPGEGVPFLGDETSTDAPILADRDLAAPGGFTPTPEVASTAPSHGAELTIATGPQSADTAAPTPGAPSDAPSISRTTEAPGRRAAGGSGAGAAVSVQRRVPLDSAEDGARSAALAMTSLTPSRRIVPSLGASSPSSHGTGAAGRRVVVARVIAPDASPSVHAQRDLQPGDAPGAGADRAPGSVGFGGARSTHRSDAAGPGRAGPSLPSLATESFGSPHAEASVAWTSAADPAAHTTAQRSAAGVGRGAAESAPATPAPGGSLAVQRFGLPSLPSVPGAGDLPDLPDLSTLRRRVPGMPDVPDLAEAAGDARSRAEDAASGAIATARDAVPSASELRDRAEQAAGSAGGAAAAAAAAVGDAAAAAGAALGGGAAGAGDVEQLVRRLYGPLVRRIKAELLLDRERRGIRIDGI
ncbi:hypothetical protein [Agromyces kandeliae]|uniref:Uncharacterized protein n=1 Tax=Agromyces kandeliae TaxID=2666141 RepID=A0A6L5R059_9MICO|nr:hypothetical protein [Agromyces kandeliae]MRX43265.1 hypothetical protein [Agromyces kandeliae]